MSSGRAYNVRVPPHMLLTRKMNGVFYTPKESARFLANRVVSYMDITVDKVESLKILDPMVGSGELLLAFCEEMLARLPEEEKRGLVEFLPQMVYGTDEDQRAVDRTKSNLACFLSELTNRDIEPGMFSNIRQMDALLIGEIERAFPEIFSKDNPGFPAIVANPPWEVVKVNDREFFSTYDSDYHKLTRDLRVKKKETFLGNSSTREQYQSYRKEILDTKQYVAEHYDFSKGSGEINLYRVSLERILQLAEIGGLIGVITPTGLAGEYGATKTRRELLLNNKILEMWGFSIGAKLFPEVDVSPLFTILSRGGRTREFAYQSELVSVQSALSLLKGNTPRTDHKFIVKLSPDYVAFTPISNDVEFSILNRMYRFPLVSDQTCGSWNLEVGRELDETNDREYITNEETPFRFLKGREISPFQMKAQTRSWVKSNYPKLERRSHDTERIVWRDIARANKERRMFATIAPANHVLGNSLNYFEENLSRTQRHFLLGVWSSLLIEYRLRQLSTNNHFNMYVTRQMPIPRLDEDDPYLIKISQLVNELLREYSEINICRLEALVASLYGITRREFDYVLSKFPKIRDQTKQKMLQMFESVQVVQNHDTATLSELDKRIVKSIPEGEIGRTYLNPSLLKGLSR